MQTIHKQNKLHKSILLALIGTGLAILVATFFGKEVVKIVTDILYIPVTGVFVAVASLMALRFRSTGSHGKAWLFFLVAAISWFIAETLWSVYELAYNANPFPSVADVFYIGGYPFLFAFLMYYLKPVRRAITKKMLATAIVISVGVTIPGIYMAYSSDPHVTLLENVLATAYPIADAIVFVPALIGISLFFRGEVNFTWSLVCIGILCFTIGDLGFQFTTFTNTYYTGHPVDIILMWSYILFSFGAYDHLKIFKRNKSVDYQTRRFSNSGL